MALENSTFISDLVATNPTDADQKAQGAAHLRLIKAALKTTLPGVTGAVTTTHNELNFVAGVTSGIQAQIAAEAMTRLNNDNAEITARVANDNLEISARQAATALLAPLASPALTGTPTVPTAAAGTATTQIATTAFVTSAAFSAVLPGQTGNAGKFVTTNGSAASWTDAFTGTAKATVDLLTGTAIASAATINLDTATGNRVHITGTTAITAVTLTRGPRTVIFDGVLTLTHSATTNNLPGAVNITTAAGDRAIYESDGTTVYCVSYIKANGASVVAPQGSALVLLGVIDLAGATTAEFNGLFSSSYSEYVVIGSGISSAVRTFALYLKVKIAGSIVSTGDHKWCGFTSTATGSTPTGSITETSLPIWNGAEYSGTASVPTNFQLSISDPLSTSLEKVFKWSVSGGDLGSPPNPQQGNGSGRATKIAALTGIQFSVGGNTWGAGKIRLYGVANA